MRVRIAVFVLCAVAAIMTTQPNNRASLAKDYPQTQSQDRVTTANADDHNCKPCNNSTDSNNNSPKRDAPLKRPEWWLVILGFPTLVVLLWQAIVNGIAAKAARDGVELQITKERARVRIIADVPILSHTNASVDWSLENYGATYASVHVACVRLVLTPERETVPDYSKCKGVFVGESMKPDTRQISAPTQLEPDSLTAAQLLGINNGTLFVHLYGFVKYQDLFDRRWRRRIHLRLAVSLGGIMQWWELAGAPNENWEIRADPAKPRWWEFQWLRKAIESIKQEDGG